MDTHGAFVQTAFEVEPSWLDSDFIYTAGLTTMHSIGFAALMLALSTGQLAGVSRVLSWRPLTYVGTVSYGVYLFHSVIMELTHITSFVVIMPLTLFAAAVSWSLIEQPILNAARRATTHRISLAAPAISP